MGRTITLIAHGTFAREARWWRLGTEGETTFADRLEKELARRGLAGTVWEPALAEGFDYSSFAWSGRNRHRDRLKGARGLSASVNQLAQRVAATPSDPLTVNLVAHSHGGNVVLEALRHLEPNVRVGRIALLGTPLVTARPAFRIARFVFSTALLALLLLILLSLLIQLGALVSVWHFLDIAPEYGPGDIVVREGFRGRDLVAILVPALVLYGWAFWLLGNLLDVAYRVLYRLAQPLQWLRGKAASLVYGPSPRRLATILGGRQILMLTSRNDEADLLLQVGSAPARLYREYVATEFSRLGRLLEFVFLRPFVLGVFLKAFEMLLEVISLGVSVWRTLVLDFEVAPPDEQPYYPGHLLVRQRIDIQPGVTSSIRRPAAEAAGDDSLKGASTRPEGLRLSLREVTDEIKRQIQLRHSAYYDNEAVTRRVAEFLAGGEVEVAREPEPAPSLKPPDWYWEALLVGNIGLAVAFASTAGGRLPSPVLPYMVALNAYAIPLAFVGVNLLFHRAVRRRMPARPWRWSWVAWAVWVLMTLLVALGLRHGT